MIPSMILFSPFQKAFVRAHTRKGKQVGSYFTSRQKKIGTVKHTKKTRVDYSEKEAQLKIKLLNEKKKHHELHVEAAKELKEKVDSHKEKGNTTFKIGTKEHDISKVTKDLNDHIDHHSNQVKSHDNHISKIKDRYKTDREFFEKKKTKSEGIVGRPKENDVKYRDSILKIVKDHQYTPKGKMMDKSDINVSDLSNLSDDQIDSLYNSRFKNLITMSVDKLKVDSNWSMFHQRLWNTMGDFLNEYPAGPKKDKIFLTPDTVSKKTLIKEGGNFWERDDIKRVYLTDKVLESMGFEVTNKNGVSGLNIKPIGEYRLWFNVKNSTFNSDKDSLISSLNSAGFKTSK